MYAAPQRDRDRIDGLAAFAAAAFLTGMGLVAALAKVGAPDALVETLGPLIALFGLAIVGALNRTARLGEFLAARRAAPPIYGGLALAASAAGFVQALLAGASGRSPLPMPALALGLAAAALLVGPYLRDANASSPSDLLATRFPAAPARWAFALALFVIGTATATAGFGAAAEVLVAHVGLGRRAAEVVVALSLALTVVPGGLQGLVWSDAASAGGALAIAAIGAGLAWAGAPSAQIAATMTGWLAPLGRIDSASLLLDAACVFGAGGFLAFFPAAIAAPPTQARRTGAFGLAIGLGGLALTATALATFPFGAVTTAASPATNALIGAALWLPALALARAGVHGAARAAGVNLSTAYASLAVLASGRIARVRLAMLTTLGLAWAVVDRGLIDPPHALVIALALNLALVVPSLILARVSQGGSLTAFAAFAVGLAEFARRGVGAAPAVRPADLLIGALIAGAAALLFGAAVGVMTPRRNAAAAEPLHADPFADLPFEAAD